MPLYQHTSNRAELLADALGRALLASPPEDAFQPVSVCVGSRGMERWLRNRLALGPSGIAMNLDTDPRRLLPYLDSVDLALCMSVFPGFGGQAFIPSVLESIKFLDHERRQRGLNYRLEVDGGINATTGKQCRSAGADTLVAGTAFFKAEDRKAFATALSV